MTRIVVANSRLEAAKKIALVLRSAGLAIAGVCTSGARAAEYTRGGDCIVVSGGYLTDLPAIRLPQLCERGTDFLFLLRGEELPAFENSEYLRLRLPLVKADLVASVNLLACFREPPGRGAPPSAEDERLLLERAKGLLMEHHGFTEKQAHRFLQKKSMETRRKLPESARLTLSVS